VQQSTKAETKKTQPCCSRFIGRNVEKQAQWQLAHQAGCHGWDGKDSRICGDCRNQ